MRWGIPIAPWRACVLVCLALTPLSAAVLDVDSTIDAVDVFPGDGSCADLAARCTLRAAIQEAGASHGPDTINVPSGTYSLTLSGVGENASVTGDLDFHGAVVLTGAGAATTVIDGLDTDRVFEVHVGAAVAISGLTIRNGRAATDIGGGIRCVGELQLSDAVVTGCSTLGNGGGIYAEGTGADLRLVRVTVSNSVADAGGGIYLKQVAGSSFYDCSFIGNQAFKEGGGVYADRAPFTMSQVTFSGNSAQTGGGLTQRGLGSLPRLSNATFSENTAVISGGGVYTSGGVLTMTNVTLHRNSAVLGAGVHVALGSAKLANSIVSASLAGPNCGGLVISEGGNIDSGTSCGMFLASDQFNTDPLLDPLQDNGGLTLTHALPSGSPAIDRGLNSSCPAVDQRGVLRPFDGDGNGTSLCDVGAYEYTGSPASTSDLGITQDDGVVSYTPGGSVTYTIVVTNDGPDPVTAATVTDEVTALFQVASAQWTCAAAGGASCTPGPQAGDIHDSVDLPVGGTATYSLVVDLDPGATGNLVNTAKVATPVGTSDPDASDNTAEDTDTSAPSADLGITNDDALGVYLPGGLVLYTIAVTNAGPSDASAATVTDAVTALPQVRSASWTCDPTGGASCTAGPVIGDIADTLDVPVGGQATYALVVTLTAAATGDLVNTATVAPAAGVTDPDPADNSATDTDSVAAFGISGTVFEDLDSDASLSDGVVRPAVTVLLYQDGGDGQADGADDTLIGSTPTALNGKYSFTAPGTGDYWVVVDSKGASPSTGYALGTSQLDLWADQTYGSAGSLCDDGAGGVVVLGAPGACYGGRDRDVSDEASGLDTSEHVTGVSVSNAGITDVDFAFSFLRVLHTGDRDDDPVTPRTAQSSLRQVIQNANVLPGADTIDIPAGTYVLTLAGLNENRALTGDLDLLEDVTITGAATASTIVDAAGIDRVFEIVAGKATLSNLTIRGGAANLAANTAGGGLLNGDRAILSRLTVSGNTAGSGGGIGNATTAQLTLSESTLSGNTATQNGGGLNDRGTSTLTNVTLSGNSASEGGGIRFGNTATLRNVTITQNTSGNGAGIHKAGPSAGLSTAVNTIVADNNGDDCVHSFVSLGNNLDGDGTCPFGGAGDLTDPAPLLGPLQNNGGPTLTHALLPGSPAVDTGSNASCPVRDQRGAARPADGDGNTTIICDIGAYEAGSMVLALADLAIAIDDGATSYAPGGQTTYTITVTNAGPTAVSGATVTDLVTSLPQVASASWTCTATGSASCTPGPVAGNINDTVDLPVGGELTYTLTVGFSSAATGAVVNTCSVTPPAGTADPTEEDAVAVDTNTQAVGLQLTGRIYEEEDANADLSGASHRPGVTVLVYRDDGDDLPEAADLPAGATVTDNQGAYDFALLAGTYWVVVDSRSVTSEENLTAGNSQSNVWAEQTYGATGAWCDDGAGGTLERSSGGACHGGRRAGVSDPAPTLPGSEHLTRVPLGADTTVDFGFSFSAIVTPRDGDDDLLLARTIQGSLRQFLQNANALHDGQTSVFRIPAASGLTISPLGELPHLADSHTVLDGSTQPGFAGTPIIEVDGSLAGAVDGLTVDAEDCTVRSLAIHGFDRIGVRLAASHGAQIEGNFIGLDPGGTAAPGNGQAGLQIATEHNVIGGISAAARNVISGNGRGGIRLLEDARHNVIQGNFIGTDASGLTALGNAQEGLGIDGEENAIGGTVAGAGNVVAGSAGAGILLGTEAKNNDIQGNFIGTDTSGTIDLGNTSHGVWIQGRAEKTRVGGTIGTAANVIAFNGGDGVAMTTASGEEPRENRVLGNSIHSNAGLGIDLGDNGPTPNDAGNEDDDTGPNDLQNYPVVSSVIVGSSTTTFTGTLDSGDGETFRIEYYVSTPADPSGFGEGQHFVGAHDVTTNASGIASWSVVLPGVIPPGLAVTATATSSQETSEFGPTTVTSSILLTDLEIAKDDGVATYVPGGSLTYSVVVTNAGPNGVTDATVTDAVTSLPQVTAASWTCVAAGGASCTAGPVAGDINDSVDLPMGGSATYTLLVDLDPGATGDLVNTATAAPPTGASDTNAANDSASDTDAVGSPIADLGLTKDDGVASYVPGGSVTYSVVVANAGPSNVSGATVTDAVASLAQVASASWTCVAAGGASCTAGPVVGDINDSIDLPVGGTATYTLLVNLDPGATGQLVNIATIAPPTGTSDPSAANNSATDTDTQGSSVADLGLTKDDGVASYVPGGSVTYTVVATNAGPSDVTGATVTDAVTSLPQVASASWTCVAAGDASCTVGPVAGNINDSVNVPVGGSVTYTLLVNLDPGATGDLVNTVTVAPPAGTSDPSVANNSDADTDTQSSPIADLGVTKDDGVASYIPGSSVTYAVVATNAGPSDVMGATVTDAVTSLPQVASASWTCVAAGGASCTAGPVVGDINDSVDLPLGGTATYTLLVSLDPGATGNLVNTATVAPPAGTSDPSAANNSDADTDTQGSAVANLGITKDDGVVSYVPGGSVTYTLVVTNAGPSDVTGATVTDAVTSLRQVASASWTCLATGGANCTAGPVAGGINDSVDLPVGGSVTYTLLVNLDPGATGNLVNTATVAPPAGTSDPSVTNNSDADTDTQGSSVADLGLTKDDGVTSYVPGGSVTYTVVATNAGPSDVTGATVADPVTSLPQVASASWTCVAAGGASCTAGPVAGSINDSVNVPVGSSVTYTLLVNLDPGATGDLVNTVTVAPPAGTSDPSVANNSDADTDTQSSPIADLGVTKDDGVASYIPGSSVTYAVVATNAGPSDVMGATVTDAVTGLPQVASASWTCVAAGGASCTAGPVVGNINDSVNVPVGGTATYTLVVNLDPGATGNLVNTVTVAPPVGTSDPSAANNSATDTDTRSPVANLGITKDDGVASYVPGGSVTYAVVATNAGPSDVTGATVTDAVTSLPQVASASWTCVAAGGASCTAGPVAGSISDSVNVPAGGSVTYTLLVDLDPGATGDLVNTATVAPPAGTSDPSAANDSDADTDTQSSPIADLSITKDDGVGSYVPGGSVTYTVVATNAGPSDATGATVTDVVTSLPQVASASWTCVGASGASCTAGPVTGSINDSVNVPAGGSVTYTLLVNLDPAATGDLVNTATVAPPVGTSDPGASNDSDADTDTQAPPLADLSMSKTVDNPAPVVNDIVVFTVTVSNAGPSVATGVAVSEPLRSGYTYVSHGVSAGSYDRTTGLWTLGQLDPGDSATLTLSARVNALGDHSNAAEISAAGVSDVDSVPGNGVGQGEDDEAVQGTAPVGTDATLAITDPSRPGDLLTVTVADADMSASPTVADAVQATVTNDGTGETETLPLTETSPSSGVFQGTLGTLFGTAAGTDDDGTLNTQAGHTLTASYMDALRATPGGGTITAQGVVLGGADGTVFITPNSSPGDTLTVRVTDADGGADPGAVETVQVTVLNNATGESELLTLTETGPSTGVFEASLATVADPAAGTDDDGTLNTSTGHTLAATYVDARTAAGGTAPITVTSLVGALDAVHLDKAAAVSETVVGSAVPYVISVTNTTSGPLNGIVLSDEPPAGFKYVEDTARLVRAGLDGALGGGDDVVTPLAAAGPRPLALGPFDLAVGETVEVHYLMRAGSGAAPGEHVNRVTTMLSGFAIGNTARASVAIVDDPFLDQSTIIGKVFEDLDRDDVQDPGEAGVAQARVVLDDGSYVLTDEHGRFHFPAIAAGHRMLKLDTRSLPPGGVVATEESRIVWITPGLTARANFGVLIRTAEETIGRPGEPAVSVTGETAHHPILVHGRTEELSLLINDRQVDLASTDVRLRLRDVRQVARIKGGRFEEPLVFELDLDPTRAVERWHLEVRDGSGRTIQQFQGEQAPPAALSWDGKLDDGRMIGAGEIYLYQLVVDYAGGTHSESTRHIFGVDRESVVSLELTGGAFEVDGTELSAEAREVLNEVGTVLSRYPDERIVIEGHTDDLGDATYNDTLSRKRAEAAAAFLMEEWGFPEERIVLRWFGETRPAAPNALPEGREINRRVALSAEVQQVQDTDITDQYRTTPSASINGGAVDVGEHGRFTTQLDQGAGTRLDVAIASSQGQAVRTVIDLPRLEITSPAGALIVGEEHPQGGCSLSGGAVLCRLEGRTDPGASVELGGRAITPDADGRFSEPVELAVGANVFGVLARNASGYSKSANLAIDVQDRDAEGRVLIAAKAVPNLTVQLPPADTQAYNKNLPLTGSTDPGNRVFVNERAVEVGHDGHFATTVELPGGKSRLIIRVEDPQGNQGTIERDVDVPRTQLFLLAFGDAEFGSLEAKGAIESSGEQEDEYYTEGRLAFYLKGVVSGKYLITAAFDSGREELGDLFSDLGGDETERLLRNLDPDRYYPVYGDASTLVYDVESQGKFYLALESDEIQVLAGNFPLALTDTELAAYQRTLYGGRFVYRSAAKTREGRPNTEVVLFGADARHAHVRDELRSTGGSLYYLSHREIIEGSEEVTLLVRDKHTGLVLERTRQRRNEDYTIKYEEGRLMFQRSVSSVSQDGSLVDQEILPGHPVHIQVDYETAVDAFDKTTSGVRARKQLGESVSLGGTYVADELESGSYELGALDAEIHAGPNARIVAELAESSGSDSLIYTSDNGGLSYTAVPASGLEEGSAWKVAAELDLGGWFGRPDRHEVRLFHKQLEPGFFSSGNFLEQGTDKSGVHAEFDVTERDSLALRYDLEDRDGVLAPGAADESTLASARWQHRRERWRLSGEYFSTDVEDTLGTTVRESSLGAVRLWSRLTGKLTGALEHQQTLSGADNDQTTAGLEYQALPSLALQVQGTDGDLGSSALAGAVLALGESQIYLTERMAEDPAGANSSTVVGARSPLGAASKVYTEYQVESGDRGDRTISLVGLQRQWDPSPGLRFLVGGESSDTQSPGGSDGRVSLTAGVSYSVPDRFTVSTRNELRRESGSTRRDQFLTASKLDYKLNDDLTLLAKVRYSKTDNEGLGVTEARLDEHGLGLAYRPSRSDRFNALAQYTHLLDLRPTAAGDALASERSMDVVSVETVFAVTPRLEWITKEAVRLQEEQAGPLPPFESTMLLVVQRLNIDIWKPMALGFEFRTLQEREADDERQGWLGEVMWNVLDHFGVGGGYNFTDFSDNEFSQNDFSTQGWFLRVQGRY